MWILKPVYVFYFNFFINNFIVLNIFKTDHNKLQILYNYIMISASKRKKKKMNKVVVKHKITKKKYCR